MKLKLYNIPLFILLAGIFSCNKPNNYSDHAAEIYKEFKIKVSTNSENHLVSSSASSSIFTIQIFTDNSINYEVFLDSANKQGDAVTNVEIRIGDPSVEGGALFTTLPGRYRAGFATGPIYGSRNSFIDSLLNNNIPKYINVITTREPLGLVRGQLNSNIIYSRNVNLTGNNVMPAVATSTTGLGFIRITEDKKLYSKVTINNDDPSDPVTAADIHSGLITDPNNSVFLNIASASAFNSPKILNLTDAQYTQLTERTYYLNVPSGMFPNGKIRGQVR